MHLIYIDDSGDADVYGYSALCLPAEHFRLALQQVKAFRHGLRERYGIFVNKEFHAVDFCSGRGRLGKSMVAKWHRCEIFRETLGQITKLPCARLFNAFGSRDGKLRTLERLINRINRSMQNIGSVAMLIFDEGEERVYTRLVRKMGVYNPIPSAFGMWPGGAQYRNIPIEHVIEDPSFRRSKQSYFIQLADFCGYALLQKERPTMCPKKRRFGLHDGFQILQPICVKEANPGDPFGIIRP
jgi:hypothetical protein